MTPITITMAEAYDHCLDVLKAGLVPNLLSSPGIGKSALGNKFSLDFYLQLIDERLTGSDPTDLNGFPMILKRTIEGARTKAGYVPMETFPIVGDTIPEGKRGWFLLLDEFNSAPLAVQAAAYKLVLDKKVGRYSLHPKVLIMTAGNLATDKAIVNRLSTAMQSRMSHFIIRVCEVAWGKWADTNNIDHRVRSFIRLKKELLHNFDPNHSDLTFACPRTWEFVSKIIIKWPTVPLEKLPVIAGTIGIGAAREFVGYAQIFETIPTIEEILANPETCPISDDASTHHALIGLVANHMALDNSDILIKFVKRLDIDFQVIGLRAAIRKNREIKKSPAIRQWIAHNAQELL